MSCVFIFEFIVTKLKSIMEKYKLFVHNILFMSIKTHDGRIYIPKKIREKFGEKFRIIECKDRLILLPVAEDPLKALREEWKDIDESVEELKEKALEEGLEEAGR